MYVKHRDVDNTQINNSIEYWFESSRNLSKNLPKFLKIIKADGNEK